MAFSFLRRVFEGLLTGIVVLLLSGLTLVVIVAVVYRYAGASLPWYDEVASIMLAWLTYYGAALAALKRAHIGFPNVVAAMPPRFRMPTVIVSEVLIIAFFALMAYMGWYVLEFFEGMRLTSLRWVPLRFTQSVIPIGAALFILAQLFNLPQVWREAKGLAPVHHHEIPAEVLKR
ncbi:MAG: TRAP transporter small permease [Deinococcota bacterium]|jgi:TRAP-type C4-dicarboxylate transport system permease small subunit|nr:TRAP transporter small permease [Deinococcota bacterium]